MPDSNMSEQDRAYYTLLGMRWGITITSSEQLKATIADLQSITHLNDSEITKIQERIEEGPHY